MADWDDAIKFMEHKAASYRICYEVPLLSGQKVFPVKIEYKLRKYLHDFPILDNYRITHM